MKQLSKERLKEIHAEYSSPNHSKCFSVKDVEIAEMARRLLAVEGPEPVSDLQKVIYHFRDWNEGFPVEHFKADYVIGWMLANYPPAPVAQFWIEGNEPPEFGRYWVRYETDVGPQYCSAKWMEHNFCASSSANIHKIWLADHSRSINALRGVTHYTKLPDPLKGE